MSRVRPAEAADLDFVTALECRAFGERAWSRVLLEEELRPAPASRCFLVAEAAEIASEPPAAGYAVASYVGEVAEVHRVAVEEGQRRRGLGRRLLTALIEEARQRRCTRMLLEVAADDTGARALYAGAGFVAIARRSGYYGGRTDALVMELDLFGRAGDSKPSATGTAQ